MSLQAPEFFAELCLPFHDHTVVGNTYFAAPVPDAPLRLRIDFTGTIHADTYGGLRVAVVHPDRGEIDAVALSFVDHGTFHRRDEATNTRPNTKQYGTFDTYHRPGRPPWDGAVTTGCATPSSSTPPSGFPAPGPRPRPDARLAVHRAALPSRRPPPPGPAPADSAYRSSRSSVPRSLPGRSLPSCCPNRSPTPSRTSTLPRP